MSKLTKQDKIDIYNYWKNYGKTSTWLSKKYGVNSGNIRYMLNLIDRYGINILDRSYSAYTIEFKQEAIRRVLINNEIPQHVSLDLALPSQGLIHNWIRKYKEDGYNVINHKKGSPFHEKQRPTNQRTSKTTKRPKTRELKAYCRKRICKKIERLSFSKKKPKAKEIAQVVTELRHELHVTVTFILNTINSNPDLPHLSKSNYYYVLKHDDKDLKNQEIMKLIKEIFEEHKHRYGYRRITAQLHIDGVKINHKKVKRLMKKMNLFGIAIRRKRKYSSYQGSIGKIKPNLICRNFLAILPDRKWYSDITEFHLNGEKLYLSPIMDGFTHEIISYNISRHPVLEKLMNMLELAYKDHPALNGLIFHTDQGWQYQHPAFQNWLKNHGIEQSMSRKGNSFDD